MQASALEGFSGPLASLPEYVPRLDGHLSDNFHIDRDVFERHPLPEGTEAPPWWMLSIIRPCPEPVESCDSWSEFARRQPPLPFDPREIEQMEREKSEQRQRRIEKRKRQRQERRRRGVGAT